MTNLKRDRCRLLFAIGILTSFIMVTYGFGRNILPMIILDMKRTFGFSYTAVGIVTASHQIAYLAFSYISGKLTLKFNSVGIVSAAVIISGICLILTGLVNSFFAIGILFAVAGACAAASWIPMIDVVSKYVPEKHLSKAMGFVSSGTSYGVFLTGFAVPHLKNNYGWEMIWIIFGSAAILIFIAWVFFYRKVPGRSLHKDSAEIVVSKSTVNRINLKVIRIALLMFITGLAFIPFQTYLIPYMRDDLKLSLELGGRVWNIIGLLGMISGLFMGYIADRLTIRRALFISYVLILMSSAILFFYPGKNTVLFSGLLFGVAYFGNFGLIPAYIRKTISKERSASIFGIANLALGLGSAIGNYLSGICKTMTGSFAWIYMAICILCIALMMTTLSLEGDESKAELRCRYQE